MKKLLILPIACLAFASCGQTNPTGRSYTLTLYATPSKFSVEILDSSQTEVFNGTVEKGHKFTLLRQGRYTIIPGYAPPEYGWIYQTPDKQTVDLNSDMNIYINYGVVVLD